MATDTGREYFAIETHASIAFLESTNVITFMDEDMEVEYLEHRRPLYLTSTINGVQIRKALIDTKVLFNRIFLSTSKEDPGDTRENNGIWRRCIIHWGEG